MKRTAFAALLFTALLGGHAMADTGPTNPTSPGVGSGVPPEMPAPGSTDPRIQGSDPGRQGGAPTDGTDRTRPPTIDDRGTERGNERNGTGSGSGMGGSGTGMGGSGSGSGTGMGGSGTGTGTGSSTGSGTGSGGGQ